MIEEHFVYIACWLMSWIVLLGTTAMAIKLALSDLIKAEIRKVKRRRQLLRERSGHYM